MADQKSLHARKSDILLSVQQQKFCLHYIYNGQDSTESYRAAGYAVKNARSGASAASRLLLRPNIQKFIAAEMQKVKKESKVNFEWKEEKLRECVESCMKHDAKGILIDAKAAISAINELNKMHGDHAAEKRVNVNFNDPDLTKVRELTNHYVREY